MSPDFGNLNKEDICKICCGKCKSLVIKHIHLSTAYYNRKMIQAGVEKPMCYFCDEPHAIDHISRQSVILTSEEVAKVHFQQDWGWRDERPFHIDIEGIPDEEISVLNKGWERAYCSNPLPIDTVLVGGLVDIRNAAAVYGNMADKAAMAEDISELVLDTIRSLHKTIKEHSKRYDVKDTLVVATLVHTPAMYWLGPNENPPNDDGYVDLKEVIDRTNLKIEAFNLEFGLSCAPKLHQIGERGKNSRRVYSWNAFREQVNSRKRTLTTASNFKVARMITKYFRQGTPKSVQFIF